MMTTFEIVQLVIGSGLIIGVIRLIFSAGKFSKSFEHIEKRFDRIETDLKEINKDLRTLDSRISRIEGAFFEPRHWEPRVIKKEKDE